MNNEYGTAFPGMHMDYSTQLENDLIKQVDTAAKAGNSAEGDVLERVKTALKNVYDPEIPVNVYDLGLIYSLEVDEENCAHISMTLTSPGCPIAHTFPGLIEQVVTSINGVDDATVELVWDPPWGKEMMTEEALLQLGLL